MTGSVLVAALLLGAAPATKPPPTEKPSLLVLNLANGTGIDASTASAMTQAITSLVAQRGFFRVMGSSELQTLVTQQRQRELLGCNEQSSCLTELAGALGARFLLSGSLTRLGTAYQLSLQTIDSQKAVTEGRVTRLANDIGTLREQLPYLVAEATGTPLPPPPSRVLPYSLMGAGAVAFAGGGLLLFNALSTEGAIARELDASKTNPGVLQSWTTYQAERDQIVTEKALGICIMVAGAAGVAAGFWLNPPELAAGATHVRLLLSPRDIALAGVFP